MKKRTKIVTGGLAILVALVGAGTIWQWENVKAVSEAARYSKEELASKISEQKTSIENTLKEYGLEGISDFTFEEEEAIRKGEITYKEAMEKLTERQEEALVKSSSENNASAEFQQNTVPNSSQHEGTSSINGATSNNNPGNSPSQTSESSKIVIQKAVNQMYALKAKYLGILGTLERSAISDYKSLTAEQKKNGTAKSLVSKYMTPALNAQSSCDAEVASVLNSLKAELETRGESTEIIKTMKASYENEKALKKAYYLSLVK